MPRACGSPVWQTPCSSIKVWCAHMHYVCGRALSKSSSRRCIYCVGFFFLNTHYPGHRIDRKHTQLSSETDQWISSPCLLVSHGSFLSLPDLEGTILKEAQELGQD